MSESKDYAEKMIGALLHAAETDKEFQAQQKKKKTETEKKMTPEEREQCINHIIEMLKQLGLCT